MRTFTAAILAALLAAAAAVWVLRRRFAVVTVRGESMAPTYASGDRVLVRRAGIGQLRRGLVVVVEMPAATGGWDSVPPRGPSRSRSWIIKRVVALPGDAWQPPDAESGQVPAGRFAVQGDNPAGSYDSRIFGYCPADRLLGTVVRSLR